MKKIINLVFIFLSVLSFGQEIVVSGKVTAKKTGEPIVGATVLSHKTHNRITTDFDGKYSLKTSINDTLVFSLAGMKMQKVKVCNEKINIELEEVEIKEEIGPPYYPKTRKIIKITTILKEDIENADNPKYNFKKNAKNNVLVIYVSELTSYNFNKEDLEFQQKYKVKYSLIGSHKIDYLTKYNKLTFKYLKKKYKKTWLTEIRKDAVGLEKE